MKHPNGPIYEYPQSSTWDNLSSIISPIEAPTKWIPYSKQIVIINTFYRDGSTPVMVTALTQSGETWTKLVEQTRVINNSVMYVAAWLRETNNQAYTAVNVSYNYVPSSGFGFRRYRRIWVAHPGDKGLYKPIQAVTAVSQGLVTYTADLSAIASGTFSRIDYLFNARYVNPVVTGYNSVPNVSYSASDMPYGFGGNNNLTNLQLVLENAGYFSGFIEVLRTTPTFIASAPTDANPVPSWTPISAGAIPYNNMCYNPGSNPETYTQRYTDTTALSIVIPSYNYSQMI